MSIIKSGSGAALAVALAETAACVESERSTLDEIQELSNAPPIAMAKAT